MSVGTTIGSPHVVAITDCEDSRLDQIGGTAARLGALARAGFRMPAAFVVTADAYRDWIGVRSPSLQEGFCESVKLAYAELCRTAGRDIPVAVRSCATGKASMDQGRAGPFPTFLVASGADSVLGHIEECWLTAFAPHVEAHRAPWEIDGIAVVVQELVDARVAGVLWTDHPDDGDRSPVVIRAGYGLGGTVASGDGTPDLFEVDRTTRETHRRCLGSKEVELRLSADRGSVETRAVEPGRRGRWVLGERELGMLLDLAARMEAAFGQGSGIEWAIGTTGSQREPDELFVLQMRPLTSEAPVVGGPADGGTVGPSLHRRRVR